MGITSGPDADVCAGGSLLHVWEVKRGQGNKRGGRTGLGMYIFAPRSGEQKTVW